jgi:uncharacterized membrane protein YccC
MGLTFEIETFKLVKSRLSDWKMIDLYFYRTLVKSIIKLTSAVFVSTFVFSFLLIYNLINYSFLRAIGVSIGTAIGGAIGYGIVFYFKEKRKTAISR